MFNLNGKVALVTGASRGIGRAIALELARCGASVAFCCDIDVEGGERTQALIQAEGRPAFFYRADVSKPEDVASMVEATLKALSRIDILVNNAGISPKIAFEDLSLEQWNRIISVNLTGAFLCSKAVVPVMLRQGGGKIIMISSAAAITGSGGGAAYAASKGGMNGLVRALARELVPKGIIVNALAPRTIETSMLTQLYSPSELQRLAKSIPLGRLGQPEDIAHWVAFLASDLSDFLCGEIILLDGGRTLLAH